MDRATRRVRCLGVAAHPDDLECMALEPILRGARAPHAGFAGLVLTSGAGCARVGIYTDLPDRKMAQVRRSEQRQAASLGRYALQIQLGYPSKTVLSPRAQWPVDDLEAWLRLLKPREVFTHDLADRHPTHVAVALRLVQALRRLPRGLRPKRLVGCEVWRSLDWMDGAGKVRMAVRDPQGLGNKLLSAFSSQLADRPYDLACEGRRRANAVFSTGAARRPTALSLGMDLTPLILDDHLSPLDLFRRYAGSFQTGVEDRLAQVSSTTKRGGKA
ncbi:MAG: PIG-L deacetylase family protein [bacterium]